MPFERQSKLDLPRRLLAQQQANEAARKVELKKHSPRPLDVSTFAWLKEKGWEHTRKDSVTAPHWEHKGRGEIAATSTKAVLAELAWEKLRDNKTAQ